MDKSDFEPKPEEAKPEEPKVEEPKIDQILATASPGTTSLFIISFDNINIICTIIIFSIFFFVEILISSRSKNGGNYRRSEDITGRKRKGERSV